MFKWFGIIFSLAAPVLCKVTARGRQSREPSRAARNKGVSPRISYCNTITSWFAIALDEIRTRRILSRKKLDRKQSKQERVTNPKNVCVGGYVSHADKLKRKPSYLKLRLRFSMDFNCMACLSTLTQSVSNSGVGADWKRKTHIYYKNKK